jgi:hypothetical protein
MSHASRLSILPAAANTPSDAETLAPLRPPCGKNGAAPLRRHAGAEAVTLRAFTVIGLIGALHEPSFLYYHLVNAEPVSI